MLKNKLVKTALASLMAMGTLLPVYAEGETSNPTSTDPFKNLETVDATKYPVIDRDTANLTVKYFDDEDEVTPVEGAEFTIYKVADIGRDINAGTNGAYLPLDESISFFDATDALKYEKQVLKYYETDPENGYKETKAIGKDGKAYFKNLPVGAYFVTETKTTRYHIRSTPFLCSVPETNAESNSWNFDVVVGPKQILAGDLTVKKIVKGKEANRNNTYHVVLEIADGTYKATLPDKSDGTVKNGDTIAIKGGQTLFIYDLPAGSKFKVRETEENDSAFDTRYENNNGRIKAYNGVSVKITNDSSRQDMGVGSQLLYSLVAGGAAFCVLIFTYATKDKKKHN